ncbi:MAG: response regulator transcription factor [Lachnospiraceae bacterium]
MSMILLLEDDSTIGAGIEYSLNQEGFNVYVADTCQKALEFMKNNTDKTNFAILDLTLPDGSGYDVCKKIKDMKDIPVIFLTACDEEVNIVMGLDMGADDYITKPFRVRELISRIKTVMRRYEKSIDSGNKLQINNITLDLNTAKVYKSGREIELTALEYRLFLTFVNNRGQVLSRNQLLEGIWDVSGDFVNDNTLTVYIKRLRTKLESEGETIIETVRGRGYRLL